MVTSMYDINALPEEGYPNLFTYDKGTYQA